MNKKIGIFFIIIIAIVLIIYGILYYKNKDKVPVLCYHNIATAQEKANFNEESEYTIDVKNFEEHLKYLKRNNYKTLTMSEFYEWKEGKIEIPLKSVLITFDDGFLSNYQYAFPLLKQYDMNATVFVVGKFAEEAENVKWDGNIKTYMSYDLIHKIREEYPNIDICSHSYDLHYDGALIQNDAMDFYYDVLNFKYGVGETQYIAYPYGQYKHDLIELLKGMKYRLGFLFGPNSRDFRKATRKDDNFKIPRINVSAGMPVWKFAIRCMLI